MRDSHFFRRYGIAFEEIVSGVLGNADHCLRGHDRAALFFRVSPLRIKAQPETIRESCPRL